MHIFLPSVYCTSASTCHICRSLHSSASQRRLHPIQQLPSHLVLLYRRHTTYLVHYCLQDCPFHSMEAHSHLWTMFHAEPDLWLLLVVSKGLVGPHCLHSSLTGFLKGLHGVAALLYGSLSTQLQQVGWQECACRNSTLASLCYGALVSKCLCRIAAANWTKLQ